MTTQELMERVFQDSSEPSDHCPYTTPGDETTFDITLPGSVKLLRLLNAGMVRVANWRFRDGRILHLKSLKTRSYFKNKAPITGTFVSGAASGGVVPGFATNVDDQFNGWTVEITAGTGVGQVKLVVDSVAAGANVDLSVDSAWDTVPDNTSEFELYKNFFDLVGASANLVAPYHIQLDPVLNIADIMKIRDVTEKTDLDRLYREDALTDSISSVGTPAAWMRYGDQVWFDTALLEERSYEILYVKQPARLVTASQVPEIPLQYHEAVGLWATHNVMRMNQDFEGAYATKKELEDLMEMLRTQGVFDYDMDQMGIVVWG